MELEILLNNLKQIIYKCIGQTICFGGQFSINILRFGMIKEKIGSRHLVDID